MPKKLCVCVLVRQLMVTSPHGVTVPKPKPNCAQSRQCDALNLCRVTPLLVTRCGNQKRCDCRVVPVLMIPPEKLKVVSARVDIPIDSLTE